MGVDELQNLSLDNMLVRNLIVIAIELGLLTLLYVGFSLLLWLLQERIKGISILKLIGEGFLAGIKLARHFLRLIFMSLFLVIIGFNAWKTYNGVELKQYTIGLLESIPPDFWFILLLNSAILVAVICFARYLIHLINNGLTKFRNLALDYKGLRSNDVSIKIVFQRLSRIQSTVIWLLVIYLGIKIFNFPDVVAGYMVIALNVYLIFSFGMLIVNAVAAIVDSLDAISQSYADAKGLMAFYQRLRHLIPVLRRTLEYIIYAAVATLILTQLEFISGLAKYGTGVIQGIGIIFLSRVGVEIINLLIDQTYLQDHLPEAEHQRNATIFPIVKTISAGFIYFVAVVIVLRGLGFDPIPLLAGAGILGMVVGLGAQSLVNDLVSGFFIIFEYTFQVGDYIEAKKASGVVESIGLRTTCIRGNDGELHILQNGKLGDVVNYSHGYTNAVVNVGVSHKSDLKHVFEVLDDLGKSLDNDMEDVLEPTTVVGIDNISGPEIQIRTVTKVQPGCHKPVERELRKRIIETFDREDITIPFKQRFKFA